MDTYFPEVQQAEGPEEEDVFADVVLRPCVLDPRRTQACEPDHAKLAVNSGSNTITEISHYPSVCFLRASSLLSLLPVQEAGVTD